MKFTNHSATALLSMTLVAGSLAACSQQSTGGSAAAPGSSTPAASGSQTAAANAKPGACDPKDVKLVGQVRNESNPYEASWLDGGDKFASSVGLKEQRLTYDGDSTKQQEQISQLLASGTKCLVMNILPNGDSDTTSATSRSRHSTSPNTTAQMSSSGSRAHSSERHIPR